MNQSSPRQILALIHCMFVTAAWLCLTAPGLADESESEGPVPPALSFTMTSIEGDPVDLKQYHGQVVLMVNVASRCGFTKQYAGLQELYEQRQGDGLVILGFPCNQFGGQEPGSSDEIITFCQQRFGVTFPLFEKINVNGDAAAPLYQYLTGDDIPLDDADRGPVKWNFEKFLIGRDGEVIARYRSRVTPDDAALTEAIDQALAAE